MRTSQDVATVPADLWAKLVFRIQASDDAGLVALLDQVIRQTGVLTITPTPVIPSSAPIPWGST